MWGAMAHAIPLAVSLLTGLGWIAALVIYLVYKEKSKFVAFHALQNLFFQIFVFVCFIVSIPLIIILVGFLIIFAVGIASLVFNVLAAIKASNGEWYELPVVGAIAKRQLAV